MSAKMDISGLVKKVQSIRQISAMVVNAPRDMSIFVAAEIKSEELNGNPVRRISGNLARSYSFAQLAPGTWAVMQTQQIAPYAAKVANRNRMRFGKSFVQMANERTLRACEMALDNEFANAVKLINAGAPYVYKGLQINLP